MTKAEVDKFLTMEFTVPENSHGADLKILQARFVNILPKLDEIKDRFNSIVSARKARIADLKADAILSVVKTDEFKATKSIVQAKVLESLTRHHYVDGIQYQESLDANTAGDITQKDGDTPVLLATNISIEEHRLILDQHRFSRAKSKVEELLQKLWVCRSGLSFDKEEMSHLSGVG